MPTRDRPEFVAQSIKMFLNQDYPNKELIIIADGTSVQPLTRGKRNVRLVEVPDVRSIGEKRNIGCAHAAGDIVMLWDDDDWYSSERISAQVAPLILGKADVTGLTCDVLLDLANFREYSCEARDHLELFGELAHGTLAFKKEVWLKVSRFPHTSIGEDVAFATSARRRGAVQEVIQGRQLFKYVRHSNNTWNPDFKFNELKSVDPDLGEDTQFYKDFSNRPNARNPMIDEPPLVSCIMPTTGREHFLSRSLECFRNQDYPNLELIVVDDENSKLLSGILPDHHAIKYVTAPSGLSLGAKRNFAIENSNGEIICHWDDDDWYAPNRISQQVELLIDAGVSICGCSQIIFIDPEADLAWRYTHEAGGTWVAGATMVYWKNIWSKWRFQDLDCGEDNAFLSNFGPHEVRAIRDHDLFVGTIHKSNTSAKRPQSPNWQPFDIAIARRKMSRHVEKAHSARAAST